MRILKLIGDMFARLWRWIKETAWIQPLLIVGAIFALIFSIPYFTSWVQSLTADSANYFARYQVSLEGEKSGNSQALTATSKADQITLDVYNNSNWEYDQAYDTTKVATAADTYGYKFFLVYCNSDSSGLSEIQDAFDTLSDLWGVNYVPLATTRPDGTTHTEPFRIHTIFTDESSSNDEEDGMEGQSAFERYLNIMGDFFEEGGARLLNYTPYKINKSVDDTNYNNFANADSSNFSSPTILLVDWTKEAMSLSNHGQVTGRSNGRFGVSEVLFSSVEGDSKYTKADTLIDMWNHQDLTDSTNAFTSAYID